MNRHTNETPHIERLPMPGRPVPTILWSKESSDEAMDVFGETSPGVEPFTSERPVTPGGPLTLRHAFETREGADSTRSAAAYRNFLHYTQDVIAASQHYPGGMTTLIGHREKITIRLVRLLGARAAASSL